MSYSQDVCNTQNKAVTFLGKNVPYKTMTCPRRYRFFSGYDSFVPLNTAGDRGDLFKVVRLKNLSKTHKHLASLFLLTKPSNAVNMLNKTA